MPVRQGLGSDAQQDRGFRTGHVLPGDVFDCNHGHVSIWYRPLPSIAAMGRIMNGPDLESPNSREEPKSAYTLSFPRLIGEKRPTKKG
jgi:hypothetical protein